MPINQPAHLHLPPWAEPHPADATADILLVDDDWEVLDLLAHFLRRRGHGVLEATSGTEALDLFAAASREIRLLVTDVTMPGLSGPALAHRLRARQPELKVLFISADPTVPDLRPEDFVLRKPFRLETLDAWITESLDAA